MLRVIGCLTGQHDVRLVVLAALICAITAFASFHVLGCVATGRNTHLRQNDGGYVWPILAGFITGFGIWATHFVAVLAYDAGLPIAYDPVLTTVSLVIPIAVTTAGFLVADEGGLSNAAGGGAIIGAGVVAMHYTGMQALIVPGALQWDAALVTASLVIGIVWTSAAMVA